MDQQNSTPLKMPDLNVDKTAAPAAPAAPPTPPVAASVVPPPAAPPVPDKKPEVPAPPVTPVAPPPGGYHTVDLTTPEAVSGHGKKINFLLIFAVLILLVCGGVAAYFYISAPKTSGKALPTPMAQISPKPFFLRVASPMGDADIVNGEVLVTGSTFPNTAVTVYTDIDDEAVESDAKGNFETSVLINEEGGLLRVTAYAEDGTEKSETLQVFSSQSVLGKSDAPGQEKKNDTGSSGGGSNNNSGGGSNAGGNNNNSGGGSNAGGSNNNSGGGSNPGQQNLIEKRTVSTAAETTSAKKNETGELKKNQTDPVEFKKVKTAEVKEEKKLGTDKIKEVIAQAKKGQEAGSDSAELVMKKAEVKAAPQGALMKRHAVSGVVVSFADGTITIAHQIQQERTNVILYNANTIFQTKSDKTGTEAVLQPGARISAVGVPSDEGLLATRIHVIPGALRMNVVESVLRMSTSTESAEPTGGASSSAPTFIMGPSPTEAVTPTFEPTVPVPSVTQIPPSPTRTPPTPTTYRAPL